MAGEIGLYPALLARGLSRRAFLRFAAATTAALALPATEVRRVAAALESAPRLRVVWLRGQDCGGDTTAFLRASAPTTASLLLETITLDYHESLMASAGGDATAALTAAAGAPGYVLVVEGAIPTADGGAHCLVGGRPVAYAVREAAAGAIATIAVGACAVDGGAPAANGGPTGASSVRATLAGASDVRGPVIDLPGCPVNVENLTATLVHYLTTGEFPPVDGRGRPYFAYGNLIHNQCERRAHFEFGEFSTAWGDEAAQKGWCLYKVGCKGPETYANCPTVRYAAGTSWPIKAGHGCIGCHAPNFWDAAGDAYQRLPAPTSVVPPLAGFAPTLTVDQLGGGLVAGIGAVAGAHGAGMYVVQRRRHAADRKARLAAGEAAKEGVRESTGAEVPPEAVQEVEP